MNDWDRQLDKAQKLYAEGKTLEAVKIIESAADNGEPEAIWNLGWLYLDGIGREKNPKKALFYFEKAAELGVTIAMIDLAALYAKGIGVSIDHNRAISLIQQAAELGDDDAHFRLAIMYKEGQGLPKDIKKSMFHFNQAMENGNKEALFEVGKMYVEGEGVNKNLKIGLNFLDKAGEHGHDLAYGYVGFMYATGTEGIKVDRERAREYLRKAARLGNKDAMEMVAFNYEPVLELGEIIVSRGLIESTDENGRKTIITLHSAGMWGQVPPKEWDKNDENLRNGEWVQSIYETNGPPFLMQTSPNRDHTWMGFLDKSYDAPNIDLKESLKRAYNYYRVLKGVKGFMKLLIDD